MNIFRISIQKNDISSNKVQKKLEHGIEKVKVAQRRKYTNKNTIKSIPSVSFPRHTFSTSFFVTPQFYSGGQPSLNSSFYRSGSKFYKSKSTTDIIPKPVLRKNVNRNIHKHFGLFSTEKKLSLYDSIFRDRSKIFRRKKKDIIDNKLNILNTKYNDQNNKIKVDEMKHDSLSSLKKVEKQVKDLKESVSFYKCIMDYAYPEYVIEKNKVFSQGKKKMYLVPSEPEFKKIDSEIMENNKKRSRYLLKSIKIKKVSSFVV